MAKLPRSFRYLWQVPLLALLVITIPNSAYAGTVLRKGVNSAFYSSMTRDEIAQKYFNQTGESGTKKCVEVTYTNVLGSDGEVVQRIPSPNVNSPTYKDYVLVRPSDFAAVARSQVGTAEGIKSIYCDPIVVNGDPENLNDLNNQGLPPSSQLSPISKVLVETLVGIASVLILLARFLLTLSSSIFVKFLTIQGFATHQFVITGWTFLQGIANLGFIFALLFMAIATMLRIDNYGIRRMLPRLLIVALVINFSLFIGAALIDISRLVMAIITYAINGGDSISDLGLNLLKQTDLAENTIKQATSGQVHATSWTVPLKLYKIFILMMCVAIAMAFLAVALFVRYIALLLLLMVSPLAYVAFILPKMESLGKKWWADFFRWVMFGPVILFLLVLITRVGAVALQDNTVTGTIIQLCATAGLIIVAVQVSQRFAKEGGEKVMGFAEKQGKRAAAGVFAGRKARDAAKNQYRDLASVTKESARNWAKNNKYTKHFVPPKRGKNGELLEGESSVASRLAKGTIGKIDPKYQASVKKAKDAAAYDPQRAVDEKIYDNLDDAVQQNPAWSSQNLRDKEVAETLAKKESKPIRQLIAKHGKAAQKQDLYSNPTIVKGMDDDEIEEGLNLETNASTSHLTNYSTVNPTNTGNKAIDRKNDLLNKKNQKLNETNAKLNEENKRRNAENQRLVNSLRSSLDKLNSSKKE